MKLPKTLNICGYDFEIRESDDIAEAGQMNLSKQLILISKDQCDEQKSSSLVHEGLEAINAINDLQLSHQTISTLEANLYQVLKDNKLRF